MAQALLMFADLCTPLDETKQVMSSSAGNEGKRLLTMLAELLTTTFLLTVNWCCIDAC